MCVWGGGVHKKWDKEAKIVSDFLTLETKGQWKYPCP